MRNLTNATDDLLTREIAHEQWRNSGRVSGALLDENLRLLLQFMKDTARESGFPTVLEGFPERALAAGFLEDVSSPTGARKLRLTEAGQEILKQANADLGDKATRYVHKVRYFGSLEPVVYGHPFQWPLSAPVTRIDGSMVADRRGFLRRLFNL
jgi:hypothetical protein